MYRASFDMTMKEVRKGPQHWKLVVPGTAFFLALGYVLANWLRDTCKSCIAKCGGVVKRKEGPWSMRSGIWEGGAERREGGLV